MKYIFYPIFAFFIFVLGAQSNHHFGWFIKPINKAAEVNSVAVTIAEHPEWPGLAEKLGLENSISDPNAIHLHTSMKEQVNKFQMDLNKQVGEFQQAAKAEYDAIEALKLKSSLASDIGTRLLVSLTNIEKYFENLRKASDALQGDDCVNFSELTKYVNEQAHKSRTHDVTNDGTVDLLKKINKELFEHLKHLTELPTDARSEEFTAQLEELKALQGLVLRVMSTRDSEVSFVENTALDIKTLRNKCVEKLADSHLENNSKIRDLVRKHFANLHKTSEN